MISSVSKEDFSFSPTCKKTGSLPGSQWNIFHLYLQSLSTVCVRNFCQVCERKTLPGGCLFLFILCLGFPALPLSGRSHWSCLQLALLLHSLRPPSLCPSGSPGQTLLTRASVPQPVARTWAFWFDAVCVWVHFPQDIVSPCSSSWHYCSYVHGRTPPPAPPQPLTFPSFLL